MSQRYFSDGVCHLFGLLTNVPIPAVSSRSVTLVLLWSKMSFSDVIVDFLPRERSATKMFYNLIEIVTAKLNRHSQFQPDNETVKLNIILRVNIR